MKGVFQTREGIEVRDNLARPEIGPDEILVEMVSNGICGGDLANYRMVKSGAMDPGAEGMLIGHEGTGRVAEKGSRVANVEVGDLVSTDGGTMTDFYKVPGIAAAKVPGAVDGSWALGEPVACCVHGATRFGIELGDRVAFLGCGFMGLVSMQLAAMRGPSNITALDFIDWRLELAKKLGADSVVSLSGKQTAESLGLTEQFDVVIEVTGAQGAVDMATEMVKEHGTLVLMGYHTSNGGTRSVNMQKWNYKAIDVVNAHIRDVALKIDAFNRGFSLMEQGKLEVKSLNTVYPMSKAAEAFRALDEAKEGLVKVSLIPG